MIDADKVWSEFGIEGKGIIIGQSDSGVEVDHPELAKSYRGKTQSHDFNWYDPWYHTTSPVDLGGHGTHTLGTIVGENVGIAPGSSWFACVNLARNLANPALYLDCMQFMFAPFPLNGDPFYDGDPSKGAHIINNSWGCPEIEGCDPLVFQPAVNALRFSGIFIIASAGNDGPKCGSLKYPLPIYDEVFSVGAIDRFGNLASFSSIGPATSDGNERTKPDIVAPGVSIFSSTPGSTYSIYSGTSMAGPHVAGVVALMWSANPALIGNIELTEEMLIQSTKPYTGVLPECPGVSTIPSNAYGFGVVNAYNAVISAINHQP
jgi:subtilisin family serine protease